MKTLSFILMILLSPLHLFASGVDISGGGGMRGVESNPWFIGQQTVSYCVKRDPEFPVSSAHIQIEVKKALASWRKVVRRYNFQKKRFSGIAFKDQDKRGIDLQYHYNPTCDADVQLTFFFGVKNAQVAKFLQQFPEKTYAFARLTHYDFAHYTTQTKGIIWLANPRMEGESPFPDYTTASSPPIFASSLQLVLLHEIGHTLGLGHLNDATVMSAHLFEMMKIAPSTSSTGPGSLHYLLKGFTDLDSQMMILPFQRPSQWRSPSPAAKGPCLGSSRSPLAKLFTRLTGEPANLDTCLRLSIKKVTAADGQDSPYQTTFSGHLIFESPADEQSFYLTGQYKSDHFWPACSIRLSWVDQYQGSLADMGKGCLDAIGHQSLVGKICGPSEAGKCDFQLEFDFQPNSNHSYQLTTRNLHDANFFSTLEMSLLPMKNQDTQP